jgi:hypothetical protein
VKPSLQMCRVGKGKWAVFEEKLDWRYVEG